MENNKRLTEKLEKEVLPKIPAELREQYLLQIANLGRITESDDYFASIVFLIDIYKMLLDGTEDHQINIINDVKELLKDADIDINKYIQRINKATGDSSDLMNKGMTKSLSEMNIVADSIKVKIEELHYVAESKIERIYGEIDKDIEKIKSKVSESNKGVDDLLKNVKGLTVDISIHTGRIVSDNLKDTIDRRSDEFINKADSFDEKVTKSIDTFTKAVEQVKTNTINEFTSAKKTVDKVRTAVEDDKTIELAINEKVDAIIEKNKDKLFKSVKNNIVSLPVTMFMLGVLVSGIASIVLSSIINKSENDYYVNLDYAVKSMVDSPNNDALKANYDELKKLVNSRRLDK